MKIALTCLVCGLPDDDGDEGDFRLYDKNVNDDGIYELDCAFGHRTKFLIQDEPFQILFEIALNAIIDGYYREAVASATASLERFYQFFTHVACRAQKVPVAAMAEAGKAVANDSQRQLGMFIAAHLLNNQACPPLMDTSGKKAPSVSFRNAVIHKGKIPTLDEAKIYAQRVLELIDNGIKSLCTTCVDAYQEEINSRIDVRHAGLGNQHRVSTTINPTIPLHVHEATEIRETVEERLATIPARRKNRNAVAWAPPHD